jgi:uncharacterized membrane-anchored protein
MEMMVTILRRVSLLILSTLLVCPQVFAANTNAKDRAKDLYDQAVKLEEALKKDSDFGMEKSC